MSSYVDWHPSPGERELLLEGLQILWDEADSRERARAVLDLQEDLAGAPVVGPEEEAS